jgi:hypothetical protein
MNLEKTINKNMFNLSTAIHNANPLAPMDRVPHESSGNEQNDTSSTLTSILTHPKQKLSTPFKRAMTMMKQRGDANHDTLSLSSSTSQSRIVDKSFDSTVLTSLIEESQPIRHDSNSELRLTPSSSIALSPKSQVRIAGKSQSSMHSTSNQILTCFDVDTTHYLPTTTVLVRDIPIQRATQPNSPVGRCMKPNLQPFQSSTLQNILSRSITSNNTSSMVTLNPIPMSSSTTTMGSGEVTILETIL